MNALVILCRCILNSEWLFCWVNYISFAQWSSFFMREIVFASVQWIENYYDENERREWANTECRIANANCMQYVRSAKMYRNKCVDGYAISNGFQCYTNIVYFGYDAIVRWNGIQWPILKTFYANWMEFSAEKMLIESKLNECECAAITFISFIRLSIRPTALFR